MVLYVALLQHDGKSPGSHSGVPGFVPRAIHVGSMIAKEHWDRFIRFPLSVSYHSAWGSISQPF